MFLDHKGAYIESMSFKMLQENRTDYVNHSHAQKLKTKQTKCFLNTKL